ncbi:MAG: MBL fold metallo-hydrolase, partial [Bryobacterales bacterium]|nr:MBL fold metallo-hydrolase [Bryobacterales bacterium]
MPARKRTPAKKVTRKQSKPAAKSVRTKEPWLGPGVRIRMYRPGLGDCFLLSFGDGRAVRHVLIDCGVLTGTSGGAARLRAIAEHIANTTASAHRKPGGLAAIVATHEHWDHVAGFFHAEDIFRATPPEQVWVAWTEDPEQTIAREAKLDQRRMAAALQLAVEKLAASPSVYDRECAGVIGQVLEFGGSDTPGNLGAAFSVRTNQGMEFVTEGLGVTPSYLKPGDV